LHCAVFPNFPHPPIKVEHLSLSLCESCHVALFLSLLEIDLAQQHIRNSSTRASPSIPARLGAAFNLSVFALARVENASAAAPAAQHIHILFRTAQKAELIRFCT
jgi:hypothetical protein